MINRTDKRFQKDEPNVKVLGDITILSSNSGSLSTALGTLKEECIQARKVLNISKENLQENIDLNFSSNEDFVTEVIALDNTDKLDALIDLDTLNNVNITFEEENYKGNLKPDILNNVQGEQKESDILCFDYNASEAIIANEKENECNIDINATQEDNPLYEDQIERESSSEGGENISDDENKKRKRTKNRLSDSKNWNYNTNKKKRQEGASYMGRKDNKFVVQRNERKLKMKCLCRERTGSKKNAFKCYILSEEERQNIFNKFWRLTWEEKKIYVSGRAIASDIKRARNRKSEGESRRKCSYSFFLDKKMERVRVCKTMFCNTLGVSMRTITHWLNGNFSSPNNKTTNNVVKSTDRDLRNNEMKKSVSDFFSELPKLESHYCRKSSSKLYLHPHWKSKTELYKFYKNDWLASKNVQQPAGLTLFKYIFEESNLSLFSPKKDECDICVGHRTQNVSEEIYQEHIAKKDQARNEKEKDKGSLNKVFTMDLQSVLLCPQSIRPGRKAGDPTVQNIRALKYNSDGSIEYKIRHSDEFQTLPVRFKKCSAIPMESLPNLYHGKLKIKREKFEHLQALKSTMETDYHSFYDSLEHD
nr:unnamed protein product [Callosobruchus chinensis]